jgi:hypothetical protein
VAINFVRRAVRTFAHKRKFKLVLTFWTFKSYLRLILLNALEYFFKKIVIVGINIFLYYRLHIKFNFLLKNIGANTSPASSLSVPISFTLKMDAVLSPKRP